MAPKMIDSLLNLSLHAYCNSTPSQERILTFYRLYAHISNKLEFMAFNGNKRRTNFAN